MSDTRFIAFYSYKGGVGRSLALANLAYVLAREGKKVLVMDMDLEAPGQHQTDLFRLPAPGPGVVEMLADYLDYRRRLNNDETKGIFRLQLVERYLRIGQGWQVGQELAEEAETGSLWLMPAGEVDKPDYPERLGKLNWDEFYKEQGRAFFRLFKAELRRRNFDYVLIDSRTGLSDEFYITTLELADTVVCVTGYNRQNIEGTKRILEVLRDERVIAEYEAKRLVLVGTPNPEITSLTEKQARLAEIASELPGFRDFNLELPYVAELALRETVLCKTAAQMRQETTYTRAIKHLRTLIDADNPISEAIPSRADKPDNPFALIRSEYITAEEAWRDFVDPAGTIMQDMNNFMPLLVTGARGSGKTMLARRFSLEVQLAEYRATDRPIKRGDFPRIGLYLRPDADFLHSFNQGDEVLREDFDHLFAQFFDILLIRKALNALENLEGLRQWCDEAGLLQALYAEFGQFEVVKLGLTNFLEFLENHIQRIRYYLNNPFPQNRPIFTQPNALMKLLTERLRRAGCFEGHYFVVLVDEYENYADYQQRIVNTRLKQGRREDGVTYRLFMRSGGLRTRETLTPGQLIEETHDYRQHALDEEMAFDDFRAYVLAVANHHMKRHPYFRERALTKLENMLEDLSPEEEARLLAGGKRAPPLVEWVKKQFPQHAAAILAWMDTEQEPLRQATAIVLLNQGKPVDKVLAAFGANDKNARDWYHNYSRGALHWLCRLYHKDKRYSGLNQLVGLSGNTIRVFLDFCHAIFAEWLDDGAGSLPIPHTVQDGAIRRQSKIFRENLRSADHSPREVNNLCERLGRLFEAKHKSPKQSEPEVNHFAISGLDEDELRDQLEKWLNDAWYEGALRRLEGTKQKSLEDLRLTDWQLVPWFAPLFNLSTRRKKKLTLKPGECYELFAGDRQTWSRLFKHFERKFEVAARGHDATAWKQELLL
ncbi:MAG: AAA family ATPase [Sulfuricellaceae bacterium]|nr:AAA family ATPase [Sulfuricellaceae bacterium]